MLDTDKQSIEHLDFDHSVQCDSTTYTPPCDNEAEWIGKRYNVCCDVPKIVCTYHKDWLIEWYSHAEPGEFFRCGHCGMDTTISDILLQFDPLP